LLPGEQAVLFNVGALGMESYDDARIAVEWLKTKQRKTLIEGAASAVYSPSGHLLYARGGSLFAVPFDLKGLSVTGPPVRVIEGLFMCVNTGNTHFNISRNGSLVYAAGRVLGGERTLVRVDRQGKEQPLPFPARAYLHPRLSPDGKQLAVEIEGVTHDFWLCDLARGVMTKETLEGSDHSPLWTPDGKRLTFRIWRAGEGFTMWHMPADRSGPEERLLETGSMQSGSSWSPDGKALVFTQVSLDTGADVWVLPMDGDRKPRPFAQTKFTEGSAKFSPDGRWIVYTSNESGQAEIYVQGYPQGPKIQVSTDGGTDAMWRRNGGELYYRNVGRMMVVDVSVSPHFKASRPRVLWEASYAHGLGSACGAPGPTSTNYDVTADGQRFLMIKEDESAPTKFEVVLNWTEELKKILASKNQ
jgi:dipeptidyl aminopeptidase/acylaminoacyl peptidase